MDAALSCATPVSLIDQITGSVESPGVIVALSTAVLVAVLKSKSSEVCGRSRSVAGCTTVKEQLACLVASATELAVMTALPGETAVTTPSALTVATPVLLLFQFTA